MNILYVVSRPLEINSSATIRNLATIKGLLSLGHDIDVITSKPDKNHDKFDESLVIDGINKIYVDLHGLNKAINLSRKIKIMTHLRKYGYKLYNKINIYDNLKDIVNYIDKVNINYNKYDIIISSSDPKSSHLFVYKLYEKGYVKESTPWIQIWGDPFLIDITRRNKLLSFKIKKEEKKLFKYAKKIIYVSPLTLNEQKNIYSEYKEKMYFIPIPYLEKKIFPKINLNKESLVFLYCGDYFSDLRNILPLYEAISETNHKLIICGDSDIKLKNKRNIEILPRQSLEKVKELEEQCDVLVHLSNLKGTQIPGKIYQYCGTNKIILFIKEDNNLKLKETFDKYNRFVFSNNNIKELRNVINNISLGIYNEMQFVLEDFNPNKIAKQIIDI
ncbi:hypothetical protein [Thermobrachium celere]|uniref:hypothetical protein n=1 Tax=Thermobrachium celere TaxID=53422 RepID=UPI0019451DDB|nr:hypothetical protein [Thermobrachium celere]GFR35998.1 hypothetical protein TCEA9_18100 [Thermobrachium celere]